MRLYIRLLLMAWWFIPTFYLFVVPLVWFLGSRAWREVLCEANGITRGVFFGFDA
jgi:hypothetical protein